MKFERGLERRALAFRRSLVPSVPINFVLINLDRTSFVYELRAVNRQITDCKHSFLRGISNGDWNVGHSRSAGGPGASSAHLRLWGLPWTRIPAGVSYLPFQSTGLFFKSGLIPNHDFKTKLDYP
jgi:hypothetical protein